jgi:hypothetical protein
VGQAQFFFTRQFCQRRFQFRHRIPGTRGKQGERRIDTDGGDARIRQIAAGIGDTTGQREQRRACRGSQRLDH